MLDDFNFNEVALIVSDLDGTLVSGKYNACQVSKRSAQVIKDLEAQGVQIVLASGRPPRSIWPVVDLLELQDPWILSCNGGMVLDSKTKSIVKSYPIQHNQIFLILKKLKNVFADEIYIGVENDMVFKCEEGYALLRGSENMNHPYELVHQLDEFVNGPVEKLVVIHKSWKSDRLHDYVKTHLFPATWDSIINITFSNPHFIEISASNVSKGSTLKSLCDKHGYTARQVIAFGDMPNDVEMIRFAGLGVAMANAHEEAKKVADYITLTNTEDGVAVVLEELLKHKKSNGN